MEKNKQIKVILNYAEATAINEFISTILEEKELQGGQYLFKITFDLQKDQAYLLQNAIDKIHDEMIKKEFTSCGINKNGTIMYDENAGKGIFPENSFFKLL